jgi:hypothetical protein
MPPEPYKLSADAYVADLAPFLGPLTGIRLPLALHRRHGQNLFYLGDTNKSEKAKRKRDRYLVEHQQLNEALHKQLNSPIMISLDDHLRYQQYRRAAGESVSMLQVLYIALKTPALPASMKVREVAKIILRSC